MTMGFKGTLPGGQIAFKATWPTTAPGYNATLITKNKCTSYGPFDVNSINFDTPSYTCTFSTCIALDMQQCGISTEGAMAFQPVLKFNSTITVLDLRLNPLIG